MFFNSEVSTDDLARLCRRLSTSLDAGIPIVKVFQRESENRSGGALASRLAVVQEHVSAGESLSDGFNATGDFFPPLFRQMTAVGEHTGRLPEVLRRLSEHYDHQVALRREFMKSIAGPLLQLVAAIVVIGLLIFILGIIAESSGGDTPNLLGVPNSFLGARGVTLYAIFWGVVAVAGWFGWQYGRRFMAKNPLAHRLILVIPVVGPAFRTLALSQLAWSFNLTFDTGMPVDEALRLSLASTGNAYYVDQTDAIIEAVLGGDAIYEALERAGQYPRDFIDTIEVGETSGRLPESMGILSRQYHEQAQLAFAVLTKAAGFAVWFGVAMVIAAVVIRMMMSYIALLNSFM